MSNPRYIVIDLGEPRADVRRVLAAMAKGSVELVSDIVPFSGVHVGVTIAGTLRQVSASLPYPRYALDPLEEP